MGALLPLLLGLVSWRLCYPPGNTQVLSHKAAVALLDVATRCQAWVRFGKLCRARESGARVSPPLPPPLVSGTLPEDGAGGGLGGAAPSTLL